MVRAHLAIAVVLAGMLGPSALAQTLPVTVRAVQVRAEVPDLRCQPAKPRARIARQPASDPLELPSEEDIEEILARLAAPPGVGALSGADGARALLSATPGQRLQVGIWGDSHLAAGFFTQALLRLAQLPADQVSTGFIGANMGRAGVRLPLKAACVSADWRYEPVYLGKDGAMAPGPGMVNLYATTPHASLEWDLRSPGGASPPTRVRVLYQQTPDPIVITLAVDGDTAQSVVLDGPVGPAALELVADAPISRISLSLVSGALRFHGLQMPQTGSGGLQLDVFGYPGATMGAWHQANQAYFDAWFSPPAYDLVMLEYGTNEGNVRPFDAAAYEAALTRAVRQWRASFTQSACLLISPGDRGVLVSRSSKARPDRGPKRLASKIPTPALSRSPAGPAPDLLRYARIHEEIGRIQARVAEQAGCRAWSMQTAMGGLGSAYAWARAKPPLMAPDLIHFTVAGYQRLAQLFARDIGWERDRLWQDAGSATRPAP